MSAPWVGALAGGVLGAIIGSFLATLILRWPEGRSVVGGRSQCDGCGRTLGWRELVPLLSVLVLRGRCKGCGGRIHPLHGAVEAGAAMIGAAAFWLAPFPFALGWAVLGWLLLTLAVLDARHFWLPDALTLPLAGLGLTIGPWVTGTNLRDALIGAAAGYGSLLAIALAYRALRGREGLGMGDAKLLGALGAWFGWQALPTLLMFAALAGLLWALVERLRGRAINAQSHLPLGTFLCLAVLPGWWIADWWTTGW